MLLKRKEKESLKKTVGHVWKGLKMIFSFIVNDGSVFALSFLWRMVTGMLVGIYMTERIGGMNWLWQTAMVVWILEPLYHKFKWAYINYKSRELGFKARR